VPNDVVQAGFAGEDVRMNMTTLATLPACRRAESVALELTVREKEILGLMAEGMTNLAICERLWLSPKTIESHVRSIFVKLGLLDGRAEHRRVVAVLAFLDAGMAA